MNYTEHFLGVTASVSRLPAMITCHTQFGFADTVPPCFPTELTFSIRATTVCGGSAKSAKLQQRMGYIWFEFGMTRDRSSFLFFRRGTRLQRELYEAFGVYKYT